MTSALLIARDGGTCVWCGREPWPADLTAEHLVRAALNPYVNRRP